MTKQQYMNFHKEMCARMVEITERKNSDYSGDGNDPFQNFRQIGSLLGTPGVVEIGFLTRMSDKMSRLASYIEKGSYQVKEESFQDTCLDLANYAILLAGFMRSKTFGEDEVACDDLQEQPLSESQKAVIREQVYRDCLGEIQKVRK
jgi:hypothetical protein